MGQILNKIQKANDIKKIAPRLYPALAQEIREFLIENVSRTGGHLASNLGVVELTMALHLCLHLPEDKIVFDVGHQAYVHKLLTGRRDGFERLRQSGGMCGFPKRKESDCDCFGTGHSSTSIAAAMGFAAARDLKQTKETIVAVIGDGALTGGLAFEALNNLAMFRKKKKNMIVILNDNNMSISENVGGMSRYLNDIRYRRSYGEFKDNVEQAIKNIPGVGDSMVRTIRRSKDSIKQLLLPGMLFENMGITYYGPVNGHDIAAIMQAVNRARQMDGPVLIHVFTKKGKGYPIAENNPEKFHGIDPFDIKTGKPLKKKAGASYTDVFAKTLLDIAREHKNVTAITAAMPSGTGLSAFKEAFPERFFDVGIAEEYAVTFAAGMAASGMRPVVAVYSSFLQRAYDQILHDVCIQKLPVFFCVDRAGLVGADGETHQGLFDISYLSSIPNLLLMAPKNRYEMEDMMHFAMEYDGPAAMRYPRGEASEVLSDCRPPIEIGRSEKIRDGKEVVLLSVGNMMDEAVKALELLKEQGISAGLVNVRFLRPIDEEMLHELAERYPLLVTLEENVLSGGYGEAVSAFLHRNGYASRLLTLGIPDCFVDHGSVDWQRKEMGIDAASIAGRILEKVREL